MFVTCCSSAASLLSPKPPRPLLSQLIPNGCDPSCVDCYQVAFCVHDSHTCMHTHLLVSSPPSNVPVPHRRRCNALFVHIHRRPRLARRSTRRNFCEVFSPNRFYLLETDLFCSGLGFPSQMGPLAGSAITATSNATGSGGGHGGMGSLGCGVYRWDSNYETCAYPRCFCLFLCHQHLDNSLISRYGSLVWDGLGGFGSGGGDGQVQGGQGGGAVFLQVKHIPVFYLL